MAPGSRSHKRRDHKKSNFYILRLCYYISQSPECQLF
nr:MAG TPA: hypothetical protein [Caudoviricetes sp.]